METHWLQKIIMLYEKLKSLHASSLCPFLAEDLQVHARAYVSYPLYHLQLVPSPDCGILTRDDMHKAAACPNLP